MKTNAIKPSIFETPNYIALETIFNNSHMQIPENHSSEQYMQITYCFRAYCKSHPDKEINIQGCRIPKRCYFIPQSIIPETIASNPTKVIRYVSRQEIERAGKSIKKFLYWDIPKSEVMLDVPYNKQCCREAKVFMGMEAREL